MFSLLPLGQPVLAKRAESVGKERKQVGSMASAQVVETVIRASEPEFRQGADATSSSCNCHGEILYYSPISSRQSRPLACYLSSVSNMQE